MFSKMNDKVWCFIGLLVALWSFRVPCFAENSSVSQLLFQAESFDYATPIGWGFPVHDAEDDTVGLTPAQRTDLSTYPERWLKAWIRLYVQPSVHKATVAFCDFEDDMNPLYYSHLRFENIRISNMHELGIYPKPWMVFAANPSAFLDEPLQTDGDWWYMEIIIEKRGRTEEEITKALRQAEITCDAYVQHHDQYDVKTDIFIDLSVVERHVLFEANEIEINAGQCKKSDVLAGDIFANYGVSEDLETEAQSHPERFQCYALQLTLANHSSYDIRSLDYWSVLCDHCAWLMYYEMEYCSTYSCKSGATIPVAGYYLILRKPEYGGSISEQAISETTIPIVIHTEFAGILREGEAEGTLGYDGMPFTIEIDMSNCKTN